MDTSYLGSIQTFAINFAPLNWMFCNGQLLPISQYATLFSLLGTQFGGNGTTNFALPNLNGNNGFSGSILAGANTSNAPGVLPSVIGEFVGSEGVSLLSPEMPPHNHHIQLFGTGGSPTSTPSAGATHLAPRGIGYGVASSTNTALGPMTLSTTGAGTAHNNDQPALAMYWCICVNGYFPPHS